MLQNNRKTKFSSMWFTLWGKKGFVNIYPQLLVCSKKVVLTNPNFPQDLPLIKHCKKKILGEYISPRFCDSQFYVKWKVLYEFPSKHLKKTEWHCLAVCGSPCGEKQFCLIFIPF